jgi:hypothetical protein
VEFEPEFDRDSDPKDEFEQELRQAFERRPAPPRLKRKVMEEVRKRHDPQRRRFHVAWWQQLAAGVALAAVVSGTVLWRQAEERRRGEAARQQLLTALRITGHALNEVNSRLAARDRGQE